MTPRLHLALSALSLLAVIVPVALIMWTLFYARRNWRSWLIYSPPAPRPSAPDPRRSGPPPGVPDLRVGAREVRPDRHRPRRLPAQGREGTGGERSLGRELATQRGAG